MKYFFDTNIISYVLKGKFPSIAKHIKSVKASDIGIPSIVLAEIEYGAQKCINYKKTIEIYSRFINSFKVFSFSAKSAFYYGQIRSNLEKEGRIIGLNDLLIASIVLAENGILVTNNIGEFSRIPNLKIENWTEE